MSALILLGHFRMGNSLRSFHATGATLAPSARALVFLDNHETQRRGQQVASATHPWLTFRDAGKYTLATAFMLAYDYGFVRIMSSYNFSDVNEGPPTQPDGSIKVLVLTPNGRKKS